jgi:hypothetical protein
LRSVNQMVDAEPALTRSAPRMSVAQIPGKSSGPQHQEMLSVAAGVELDTSTARLQRVRLSMVQPVMQMCVPMAPTLPTLLDPRLETFPMVKPSIGAVETAILR